MKSILIAAFLVLMSGPVYAQEHAPLPEQCRADVRLWISQNKTDLDKLSFKEIQRRQVEMFSCLSIDSGTGESIQEYERDSRSYNTMFAAYHVALEYRLINFINRHSLNQQFLDEDAAGER